jgi:hypothetical protein
MPVITRPTDDEVREEICSCYPLSQPEEEYSLCIKVQPDGSGRFHCDNCGKPMSPIGRSRADYLTATPQPPIAAEPGERKLRPCSTVCKGSLIVADTASTDAPSSFRIECEYCGAIGSEAPTEAEAVNAWNQRGDSYMALAEEIIRGLTECGNRMSVGDQVRLAHRLATLTPPERTAGEVAIKAAEHLTSIDDPIRNTNVSTGPYLTYTGQHVVDAFKAGAALRQPATDRESVRKEAFEEAYDKARGTNADLCKTPVAAYRVMLDALLALKGSRP